MKRLVSRAFLLTIISAVIAAAAPSSEVRGSFSRTFQVSGPVDLEVTNGSGDVTVRTGSTATVEIRAKIHASGAAAQESRVHEIESNPPLEQDGNTIRVRQIQHEEGQNISIDYEITTPPETRLNSRTGSGDVTVEGIRGPVEAQTGSGDVKMSAVHGNITAQTGSGDTRFDGIDAERVEIQTGSGDVEVHDVHCALEARTGSGDIRAVGNPTGAWRLNTGSGEIKLNLPADLGFDLDARSQSGDVNSQLPISVQGMLGRGELRGKVRGGGVPVELQTGSGDISID